MLVILVSSMLKEDISLFWTPMICSPTSIKSRVDYMTLTNSSFVIGCYRRVDEKHNSLSTVIPQKLSSDGVSLFVITCQFNAMYDSRCLESFINETLDTKITKCGSAFLKKAASCEELMMRFLVIIL